MMILILNENGDDSGNFCYSADVHTDIDADADVDVGRFASFSSRGDYFFVATVVILSMVVVYPLICRHCYRYYR